MAMISMCVNVDEATESRAASLLSGLGLDISGAVNLFLNQVVLYEGLPFEIRYPQFRDDVVEAMEEAKKISRDPNTTKYDSFADALEDMDL